MVSNSFFLPTLAGLLWGSTNPAIKIGSKGMRNIKGTSTFLTFMLQVKFLCSNWKYVVPLLCNQLGSVVYYIALQQSSLSLCVPFTNSVAFICTVVCSWIIEDNKMNRQILVGIICLLFGVSFLVVDECKNSKD